MDEYQARMGEIRDKIHELRLLRDAQTPDSRNHTHFQDEINTLTSELLAWKRHSPRIGELDMMVQNAARQVDETQRKAQATADVWSRTAAVSGGFGGLLVLISLVWTPSALMPALGGLLLAIAVGALFLCVQARRHDSGGTDRAREALAALQRERQSLLPGGQR